MTGDRNSCCCSFLLKRFEKIFLSPEQTLGLSLPCWHCHLSGCDESSVGTFSRLCKKSVVLHFFVLVQDEASDLTVFLHLDLQILINSFLWHFRYFLTAVEKRGKKKKDRKKKKSKKLFLYCIYFQEWYLSFADGYFCSSDYECLLFSHIEQTILLHHTDGRYTLSYIQMSESCLEMYFLLSDMGTFQLEGV